MALYRRTLLFALASSAAAGSTSIALAQAGRSEPKVAIGGYDTVAYFTVGRPEHGSPSISHLWDGKRYLFMSEQNRELFVRSPEKYAPQFSGHCAAGMSAGMKIEADPANWIISDGRLFLFAGGSGPDTMRKDPTMSVRADGNWTKLR